MFIRIIKRINGLIEVELVNEDKEITIYRFQNSREAKINLPKFLNVVGNISVVCLEESITTTSVELDSILI